jgi:ABC-type branched-subunit amino acid transport system ATPase component
MRAAASALAAPNTTGAIELDGVARRYDVGDVVVTALEGVNLRIESGEFIVVLGPSGSGKTTLLNMIGALDSPTEGRLRIAGRDITNASRRELIGLGVGLLLTRWVVHGVVPDTFPDIGVIVSLNPGSLAVATALGTAAVALAPLFTTRRMRRMDVPSTLRVVE